MSFGEFVTLISRQRPREMDPHWRNQTHNLYSDIVAYDRLLRFERLEEEMAELLAELGEPAELRSVRKGSGGGDYRARFAKYYTPEIAEQVRETYADDFSTFGYSTEAPV